MEPSRSFGQVSLLAAGCLPGRLLVVLLACCSNGASVVLYVVLLVLLVVCMEEVSGRLLLLFLMIFVRLVELEKISHFFRLVAKGLCAPVLSWFQNCLSI